jgi:AcrR family transcriptional regulator
MSIGYNPIMSPAPARTSRDAIVLAARAILEEDGLEAVSMGRVAERVGVRGPSLYKHVTDRAALIRAIGDAITVDLGRTLAVALDDGDPRSSLRAVTAAFRTFVHANPNGYGLLFAHLEPNLQPDQAAAAAIGEPLVLAMARIVGEQDALEAARTLVAWAHGFVSMELAGTFRLGGDVDAAYAFGLEAIVAGVSGSVTQAGDSPRRGRRRCPPPG